MSSREDEAVDFKNKGNAAFAAHDWPKAIELYTKAIELKDDDPVFYSNRAQVCPNSFKSNCSCD
jgi:serine/threonine-protein phosphatase 5